VGARRAPGVWSLQLVLRSLDDRVDWHPSFAHWPKALGLLTSWRGR
jgi:hypothetical protein